MEYYNVSSVPKIIGYNNYVDTSEEIFNLYDTSISKPKIEIDLPINNANELSQITSNILDKMDKIDDNIDEINKMRTYIIQSLNCKYGNDNEKNVINMIKEKYGYEVHDNNKKCYSKIINNIKICGRVDGFIYIDDVKYILEIKSRKNRIFKNMPIYEKVQIILYTKLCECNNVIYCQNYNNELTFEIMPNFEDNNLYENIISRLKNVHDYIEYRKVNENSDLELEQFCPWI